MHANPSSLTVSENGLGPYQQTVSAGRHTLIADEPLDAGGDDAGLAPFDFLLAALGSCTSITLRMYAQRKGLALTHVSVALTHQKIDLANGSGVDRLDRLERLDHIERIITLEGELSVEQRQRLLEIANKCPMYRTLQSDIRIDSRIVG
jgi:putative redox protein